MWWLWNWLTGSLRKWQSLRTLYCIMNTFLRCTYFGRLILSFTIFRLESSVFVLRHEAKCRQSELDDSIRDHKVCSELSKTRKRQLSKLHKRFEKKENQCIAHQKQVSIVLKQYKNIKDRLCSRQKSNDSSSDPQSLSSHSSDFDPTHEPLVCICLAFRKRNMLPSLTVVHRVRKPIWPYFLNKRAHIFSWCKLVSWCVL